MQKCKVCGRRFRLLKKNRYEVKKTPVGLNCLIEGATYFNAFDCPFCGCQNIVGVIEKSNMTNEEAIKNLKEHKSVYTNCAADAEANETIEMAIKALEQEPCADIAQERYKDLCEYFGGAKDILKSREDFKAWLGRVKWHIRKAEELYEKYEYKQEPKTGHWREDIDNNRRWDRVRFYCSECGNWQTYGKTDFCPNCGVKMEESESKHWQEIAKSYVQGIRVGLAESEDRNEH